MTHLARYTTPFVCGLLLLLTCFTIGCSTVGLQRALAEQQSFLDELRAEREKAAAQGKSTSEIDTQIAVEETKARAIEKSIAATERTNDYIADIFKIIGAALPGVAGFAWGTIQRRKFLGSDKALRTTVRNVDANLRDHEGHAANDAASKFFAAQELASTADPAIAAVIKRYRG